MPSITISLLSALMVTATLAAPHHAPRGKHSHSNGVSHARRVRLEWTSFRQWFHSNGTVSSSSASSSSNSNAAPVNAKLKPKAKAAPVPASSASPAPAGGSSSGTTSSNASGDIKAWLEAHNAVRVLYGVANVTWSDKLVPAAQAESDTCIFQHTKNNVYGENIAAGQNNIATVVDQWVSGPDEKSAYDPANPTYSHFTQVVWKGTTEIGCAKTTCPTIAGLPQANPVFWTCEYNPPGNVIGQFADNVLAKKGGAPL